MTFLAGLRQSPTWPMLWKEFRADAVGDRFTLGMMIGIPAIQILLFGFAIRTEVRHLPTVVLDESRSAESRALVQAMAKHAQLRHDRRGELARGDSAPHRTR
jgi:hypothetical protein